MIGFKCKTEDFYEGKWYNTMILHQRVRYMSWMLYCRKNMYLANRNRGYERQEEYKTSLNYICDMIKYTTTGHATTNMGWIYNVILQYINIPGITTKQTIEKSVHAPLHFINVRQGKNLTSLDSTMY